MNSRKKRFFVTLTVLLGVYGSLLGVGSDSVNLQQSIGIKLCFWKCLKVWFWFHTFLWILQVLLCFFMQPLALNFVPLPSICIMECIRSTNRSWIFAHQCFEIGFDPPLKTCLICQKSNLFAHVMIDTNLIMILMMIRSWK